MKNAAIAQSGPPRDLYEQPANSFVADFIGEANIMEASVTHIDASSDVATVELGSMRLQLPARGVNPGTVKLAVRPNRIRLTTVNSGHCLSGIVRKSTYVGNHMEYVVTTDHGDWFSTTDNVDDVFTENQNVFVEFHATGPVLLSD